MEVNIEEIAASDGRFNPRAHLLVLQALERAAPRHVHVSGASLARAVCELARERYGIAARLVLTHWGLRSSADIGHLVFALVEHGIVRASPEDSVEDFVDVVDLQAELDEDYPWGRQ